MIKSYLYGGFFGGLVAFCFVWTKAELDWRAFVSIITIIIFANLFHLFD